MSLRRLVLAVVVVTSACLARAEAQEPVLLRYKVAKGDTLYYRNVQEFKQSQTIFNMKLENTMKQEAIVSQVVDDVDAEGKATIKMKAERRKIAAEFGALGKFEFDSKSTTRDTSSAIGAAVTPLFERLTGSEYQIILNPLGNIVEVKGFAELVADLVKDNPLAAQFGAGDNKTAAATEQDSFAIFSEKAVKPGDSWEVPFDLEMVKVGKMRGKTTYTYEAPDQVENRKTVRIGVTSEVSFELLIDNPDAKVTGTLSSNNYTATIQFDPTAGRVLSIKRSFTMSGQLTVEAGGMTIPVDNQQEHTATTELLDKLPE